MISPFQAMGSVQPFKPQGYAGPKQRMKLDPKQPAASIQPVRPNPQMGFGSNPNLMAQIAEMKAKQGIGQIPQQQTVGYNRPMLQWQQAQLRRI